MEPLGRIAKSQTAKNVCIKSELPSPTKTATPDTFSGCGYCKASKSRYCSQLWREILYQDCLSDHNDIDNDNDNDDDDAVRDACRQYNRTMLQIHITDCKDELCHCVCQKPKVAGDV